MFNEALWQPGTVLVGSVVPSKGMLTLCRLADCGVTCGVAMLFVTALPCRVVLVRTAVGSGDLTQLLR